jgi:serine phosphatase RsbU (regulator of sigma subunit)
MLNIPRLPYLDSSLRGALALGALLFVVLVATLLGAFRIYAQLDRAAAVQRSLVRGQEQLYGVLKAQQDEELGVRGYTQTKKTYFLGHRVSAHDDFDRQMNGLRQTVAQLQLGPSVANAVEEMSDAHHQWEREVAEPLSVSPLPKDAVQIQETGKVLTDEIDSHERALEQLLNDQVQQAQRNLIRQINETLAITLLSVFAFGAVGIVFLVLRRRMIARLERERRIIETLQGAFRTGWDRLPRSRIGTAYISATRDAEVGGDLFDVRRLDDDRGLVIVADVSGKGIEAAVNTAFVKYSIRTLALEHNDPGTILAAFNRMFLDTIGDPSLFVVVFVGIFDLRALRLTYASAGHSGAFLRRGREVSQLDVTGPIIGLDKSFTYASRTLSLQPHDLVVLATAGLTEARDRHGRALDEAGAMTLVRESSSDPQACANELVQAVKRRGGGRLFDDLALLVIAIDDVEHERERERAEQSADAAA